MVFQALPMPYILCKRGVPVMAAEFRPKLLCLAHKWLGHLGANS